MDIKISIIVPVYNLADYLSKCVDSILAQSFTKFELILVNDGSTDRSGEICEEYAKIDNRVKVIHKNNGGVASSRNAGLEIAKGEYIGYVDNDDYINKFMFEALYSNAVTHSSDIVVCEFINIDEGKECDTHEIKSDYQIENLTNLEALDKLYTDEAITFTVPWNKLYKRELFTDVIYQVGNIHDDETVVHELLYKSTKITHLHTTFYYYIKRRGSQINSPLTTKRFGKVYALRQRVDYFKEHELHDLHEKALRDYLEFFIWYYYTGKSELKGIKQELKMLKKTFNTCLLSLLRTKGIGTREKATLVLFWISPSLFKSFRNLRTKQIQRYPT